MEKLNEAIKNYIDSDELFALFIDGQWGVGKTYYIKNKILKEFDDKIEIRYISLYGLQNLYEIKSIIISKLINTSTKNLRKVLKSMKNFQVVPYLNMNNFSDNILRYIDDNSLKKIKNSLMKNNKSALLIIDDVERMSDKVSFEEFLGFIRNDLIDYLDCKVLFIGNLDELNKKADFHKNSEKIISRILKFPNNREVAMDIVKSNLPKLFVKNISTKAVTYTHLRAHETGAYIVCRLLLEKKKTTLTVLSMAIRPSTFLSTISYYNITTYPFTYTNIYSTSIKISQHH
ncbi:DnaA ATPase domain-containing protein [Staphylococcus aureus]|uniref:DnaA ATPase domain-containing protein n=1 Tax=Staphylococcus aureus TaxID=1280 RepID=UPI001EF02883